MTAAVAVARLDGGLAELASQAIDHLRERVRGAVLTPEDPRISGVRSVFNAMHPSAPGLVVSCSGAADVVEAVRFAREHELLLAVRGGGHSIAGLSAGDGGLLVDLSPMCGVLVDEAGRLARVQGGALWRDVDRETQALGLATPGGNISDTGVAGLALGGGYGHLRRKLGLTSDNLIEAQLVAADGTIHTASAESNPDLLWAIRGGGGNFGIVTSFTFALHRVGPIVASGAAFYAVEDAAEVLRAWRAYTADAADEVSSSVTAITPPNVPSVPEAIRDRACVVANGVYAGEVEQGIAALAPLAELATPIFASVAPVSYVALQSGSDALMPRNHFQAYWKSQYLPELSDAAIEAIARRAAQRPHPITSITTLHMGGAIGRVGPEETAFAERSAPFLVTVDGFWTDAQANERNVAWVSETWDALARVGTGGVYLNFLGRSEEAIEPDIESALGRNLQRLAEIKARYDPDNVFRLNNNIAPAAEPSDELAALAAGRG